MSRARRRRAIVFRHPDRSFDESGQSYVELAVAIALFAIILTTTALIVSVAQRTANATVALSNSTENVLTSVTTVEHYLSSAVTPSEASIAGELASPGMASPTSGYPCWGTSVPNGTGLTNPDLDSIIIAHDFDMEFCGYGPSKSGQDVVPHVWRIWLDPTTCVAAKNTCSLKLDDYSANCGTVTVSSTSTCTSYNTYALTTQPTTRLTIPNVWCDSTCRTAATNDANVAATGSTAQTNNDLAACTIAGTCSATNASPSTTPPLFTYFGSGGAASGALNPSAVPLLDVASNDGTGNTCMSPPSTGTPLSDCSSLGSISSIRFEITIMCTINGHVTGQNGSRSLNRPTAIIDQIFLSNLVTTATAPWPPTAATVSSTSGTACGGATLASGQVCVTFTLGYDGGDNPDYFTITPYSGTTQQGSLVVNPCTSFGYTVLNETPAPSWTCSAPGTPVSGATSLQQTSGSPSGDTDYQQGAIDYDVVQLVKGTTYTLQIQGTNSAGSGGIITTGTVTP